MARPTARVLALLEMLQSGGTHSAGALAERLEVDERTVRRYIDHMIDLDIPVGTTRGRYGGYHLAPGYRMPPLMFTDDEALAVMIGLLANRRSGTVTGMAEAAEAAVAKLARVLQAPLAKRLDALQKTVDFVTPSQSIPATQAGVLMMIAEAARDHLPLVIDYTDKGSHQTERTVHPYGIVSRSGQWYLSGADSISSDVRNFRLDRINRVRVVAGSFETPPGFDATAQLAAGTGYRHEVSVRVSGTLQQIRARLPATVATVEQIPVEEPVSPTSTERRWVRVRIRAERLDWVPALLAALDRPFVIEHPYSLRNAVRQFADRLTGYAER